MSAHVALVGAGPGDPGLLTVRGRELLVAADAVVFDRLGTERLMGLCRPGARLVDAGKAPGRAALTQEEIGRTLVDLAREGLRVVRLKGGDPFVFGRGGEEIIALADAGIPVEVVPGVTSAIAAPAYAGIPITHRAVSTSFTVVTGHEDPTKPGEQTDWDALARVPGTLVVLMGMGRLPLITERLIAAGRDPGQPAAAVQWGTTPRQQHVVATLATLHDVARARGIGSPAVVVIGDVAGLSERLAWRPQQVLKGRSVVVTRARAQASQLSEALRAHGADVIEMPVIRIEPLPADETIGGMLDRLREYRALVLTSVNGVEQLFARMAERGLDARAIHPDARIVAIGPATARALERHGLRVDTMPERHVAEGILDSLEGDDLTGVPVLVARAQAARSLLVDELRARGARVDEVALYRTVPEPVSADQVDRAVAADYVTFTSSSTVTNFVAAMGDRLQRVRGRVVSIGPITSETLADAHIPVDREAEVFTIAGVCDAVVHDARRDS